jgi:hypothetical protein
VKQGLPSSGLAYSPGTRAHSKRPRPSIVPSDIQFDISAFLAVPPQKYGGNV